MRDLNKEYQDTEERKYAYDFDYIHRDYMLKHFTHLFTSEQTVLEMGCFEGGFTKSLLDIFEKVTVVEGSSDLINKASMNVDSDRVTFIHSYFEEMELVEKYDIVFLMHTLEHLDDRKLVLSKIANILSPQGKLILVVPNANAASRQIAVSMGLITNNNAVTPGEYEHGHRVTYSMDTLIEELSCTGLKAIDQGGILFKPLANYQLDLAMKHGIIDKQFFEGCYQLGKRYPDLCASIFAVCTKCD